MPNRPKIALHSVKAEGKKITLAVEHHPIQSYSRAVGPAANRFVNDPAASRHFAGAKKITRVGMDFAYGDTLTPKREGQVVTAFVYEVTR